MTEGTTSMPISTVWRLAFDAGRSSSYPYKLQTLCSARYAEQSIQVFNAGSAGKRASEDRDRFNSALSEGQPEVVLLMEGANDMNNFAPISSTVGAMEDMVRDAQRRGIAVMLATIPPQRPGGPKAFNPDAIPRFNNELRMMAAAKGAYLVDVEAQISLSMIGQDGLHPTDAGYDRIAEVFLEALKTRYETTTTAASVDSSSSAHDEHAITTPPALLSPPAAPRH